MWYTYTMEYYSAVKSNALQSTLMRWINLEPIREWSKLEREKQININTYIWKLEWWYWLTYLQNNKKEANIRNRLMDTVGKGVGGINWESSIATYPLPYVK